MLQPKPIPPRDPEEILVGVCGTCKTSLSVERQKAREGRPLGRSMESSMSWSDVPTAECLKCGARVFLMPRKEPT